jgi:hypothetical protein
MTAIRQLRAHVRLGDPQSHAGFAEESPAVDMGREVRLQHEGLTAAALVHDDTVIHLTAFEQDE